MSHAKAGESLNNDAGRSRGRYWLIGILFFHTVNTYMDRACISSAAVAWLFMNPKKTISGSVSPRQAKIRLVLFIIGAVLLVGGLLTYKIFFLK